MDPRLRGDDEFMGKWAALRQLRAKVNEAIEPFRRDKAIGSSLEADVDLTLISNVRLANRDINFSELFICSSVRGLVFREEGASDSSVSLSKLDDEGSLIGITRTAHHKCGRCWRHLPEVTDDGDLCSRCEQVVGVMDVAQ